MNTLSEQKQDAQSNAFTGQAACGSLATVTIDGDNASSIRQTYRQAKVLHLQPVDKNAQMCLATSLTSSLVPRRRIQVCSNLQRFTKRKTPRSCFDRKNWHGVSQGTNQLCTSSQHDSNICYPFLLTYETHAIAPTPWPTPVSGGCTVWCMRSPMHTCPPL